MIKVARVLFCVVLGLWATELRAQQWPTKPIKLIVPLGVGSATDVMARLLADNLSQSLGQRVFVENVPGASTMTGAAAAARAPGDGYTFLFGATSTYAANVHFFKSIPYDPDRDFKPVALICDSGPFSLTVRPDAPYKTLPELIEFAKKNPGKMKYGVDVSSGLGVVLGKLFRKHAGIEIEEVSYKTTAEMLNDALGGLTQLIVSSVTAVNGMVNDGKLRRIAISSAARFPGLEDLPTIKETLPNIEVDGWFAVMAPKGTPDDIILRFNAATDKFLAAPDVRQRLISIGLKTSGAGTPETTKQFVQAERVKWGAYVKEVGLEPQ